MGEDVGPAPFPVLNRADGDALAVVCDAIRQVQMLCIDRRIGSVERQRGGGQQDE
jgi:hypothetical protein